MSSVSTRAESQSRVAEVTSFITSKEEKGYLFYFRILWSEMV